MERRISTYTLSETVRTAGALETHKAIDESGQLVFFHIVNAYRLRDAETRKIFLRETEQLRKLLNRIKHPGLCNILDFGETSECAFLVTELIEARTLAERLSAGTFTVDQACRYGEEICDALAALHAAQIIHNELSPMNILIANERVKLEYFRLSPWVELEVDVPVDWPFLDSVPWTSPEQIKGTRVDERSDIFSVGTILYQMLTGKRAFEGERVPTIAMAILQNSPASAKKIRPEIPSGLSALIEECLAKNPEDRPRNARDLMERLKEKT